MHAAVYHEYGNVENLKFEEVAKPVPRDDEVLVRVHAVAINDWDWQLLLGIPFVNRMINGLRKPKRTILGLDIAGRVEASGKDAERFKPGDAVYGDISGWWGGFAEWVCIPEKLLTPKPSCLSFEDAAATSHAANLAVQGLIDRGNMQKGQRILINGAGGGVGTFGIQIAKLYGAEVTGVDSEEKLDLMRSSGYDHVIDYRKEDFTATGKKYDLILDTKTGRPVSAYARALAPNGTYVTVGGELKRIFGGVVFTGLPVSLITGKKFRMVGLRQNKDLPYVNKLYEEGKLKPVIDGPYPFSGLPQQMRRFGAGEHRGKIVLTME